MNNPVAKSERADYVVSMKLDTPKNPAAMTYREIFSALGEADKPPGTGFAEWMMGDGFYPRLVKELFQRWQESKLDRAAPFTSPSSVYEYLSPMMRGETQELFYVVYLDARNCPIKAEMIYKGTLNAALVHPRDIFRHALDVCAASVILAHNHPSGDPTPSTEDMELTRRMLKAGEIMGIEVLDHVIVGDKGLSMKEANLF